MSHQVYLVAFLGVTRDHHAIFVEINEDKSGMLFHVIGDIQKGMTYETKASRSPDKSTSFVGMDLLGTITTSNYLRVESVCQQIPPPAKQFDGPR